MHRFVLLVWLKRATSSTTPTVHSSPSLSVPLHLSPSPPSTQEQDRTLLISPLFSCPRRHSRWAWYKCTYIYTYIIYVCTCMHISFSSHIHSYIQYLFDIHTYMHNIPTYVCTYVSMYSYIVSTYIGYGESIMESVSGGSGSLCAHVCCMNLHTYVRMCPGEGSPSFEYWRLTRSSGPQERGQWWGVCSEQCWSEQPTDSELQHWCHPGL